jgi:hypothetical protein
MRKTLAYEREKLEQGDTDSYKQELNHLYSSPSEGEYYGGNT